MIVYNWIISYKRLFKFNEIIIKLNYLTLEVDKVYCIYEIQLLQFKLKLLLNNWIWMNNNWIKKDNFYSRIKIIHILFV